MATVSGGVLAIQALGGGAPPPRGEKRVRLRCVPILRVGWDPRIDCNTAFLDTKNTRLVSIWVSTQK